eukprot:8779888-Ditylum_brightwellii.AAC.1
MDVDNDNVTTATLKSTLENFCAEMKASQEAAMTQFCTEMQQQIKVKLTSILTNIRTDILTNVQSIMDISLAKIAFVANTLVAPSFTQQGLRGHGIY